MNIYKKGYIISNRIFINEPLAIAFYSMLNASNIVIVFSFLNDVINESILFRFILFKWFALLNAFVLLRYSKTLISHIVEITRIERLIFLMYVCIPSVLFIIFK